VNYYTSQIERLHPETFTDYDFIVQLKMSSEHGKTNWMNLTPDQVRQIAAILEKG